MSTDIVHWEHNHRNFQSEALQAYLYISLPLTFIVLLVWGTYHCVEKRKEKDREYEHRAQLSQSEV